ncbi:MFS transporter [Streptomyces prasinosporus]|uniref:MFS transporter n=3 Tax=Streptomyces TaxID=1883 RepID=A0ABP6U064_9ACTN|nr:MFS transporter [Streptomyces tricolor]GHC14682.1 MFS transporter [Streptomyces albogriseolus]
MRMPWLPSRNSASAPVPRIPLRTRTTEACAPLAIRPFRLHFTARMLSWTGSAVAPVGLAFAVLGLGAGASGLGLVLAAGVVPQILLLLIGGVVADRFSRARVMVWKNVLCAAAEGVAAVLLWAGSARVWHLVAISALCGAAGAFFAPAAGGVVVEVVPGEMRYQANALLKIGQNSVKVAGPAVGGALVAAFGPSWVIGWYAATFAAAAVLFARLDLAPARTKLRTGFVRDLKDGWDDFWARSWLWVMVLQGAVVVPVWLVGYQMLGPVYGDRYLGGAAAWGLVVSAFTGGLVLGAAMALMWKPSRVGVVVCVGTGAMSLPLAAMALTLPLAVLAVSTCAAGTGLSVSMTVWSSLLQERIPKERLSRILSYSTLGQVLPVPLGYVAAGPVSALFGLRATLAAGAAAIVAAMFVPLMLSQVRALTLAPAEAEAEAAVLVTAPR